MNRPLRAGDTVTTAEQIASLPPRSTLLCRVGEIFWCAPTGGGPNVWFGAGYDPAQYEWDDAAVAEWAPLTILHIGIDPLPELARLLDQDPPWVGPLDHSALTDLGVTFAEAVEQVEAGIAELRGKVGGWVHRRRWSWLRFWLPAHWEATCDSCSWSYRSWSDDVAALHLGKHLTSEHPS